MSEESKCPVTGHAGMTSSAGVPRIVIGGQSTESQYFCINMRQLPIRWDLIFNYAEEFKKLDLAQSRKTLPS